MLPVRGSPPCISASSIRLHSPCYSCCGGFRDIPRAGVHIQTCPGAGGGLREGCTKGALFEGLRFYKEAMEVLCQLPPGEENQKEQIDLVLSMQIPWRRIGFAKDYLPLLQKAEALAEELGEDKKRLMIRSVLGLHYIYKGGDPQLGWTFLENCLDYPEILQED